MQIPSEWEKQLRALQIELQTKLQSDAVRWVKPEQIHLTLRFLGGITGVEVDRVREAVLAAAHEFRQFVLRFGGLGCFPSARNPRVLWAGIAGDTAEIIRLQRRLAAATEGMGQPLDTREFTPHLTLARIQAADRGVIGRVGEVLASSAKCIDSGWPVREVILMRSHLSPQGARYEALLRAPLVQ